MEGLHRVGEGSRECRRETWKEGKRGVMEGIQGETAKSKGHLRGHMGNLCKRNFLSIHIQKNLSVIAK